MYSINAESVIFYSVQPAEDVTDQNEAYTFPSGEDSYLYSFVVFLNIVNQLFIFTLLLYLGVINFFLLVFYFS